MKKMKKIFAFMLALAMMLSLTGIVNAGKASAADLSEGTEGAAKTITITSPGNAQSSVHSNIPYIKYLMLQAMEHQMELAISCWMVLLMLRQVLQLMMPVTCILVL